MTGRLMITAGIGLVLSAGPGAVIARDEPPMLTRDASSKRDWTVHVEVALRSPTYVVPRGVQVSGTPCFILDSARFHFSRIGASASSEPWPERTKGWLRTNATPVDESLDVKKGIRPAVDVLAADAADSRCNDVTFSVDTTVTAYETKLDEKRAVLAPWPKEEWPDELNAWLKPEPFIESDNDAIAARVKQWVGPDPRAKGPYTTAKLLTSKVVEFYQPSGNLFYSGSRTTKYFSPQPGSVNRIPAFGVISGYEVGGAAEALALKRGSPLNMPCLLVACWRAAGIPSRMVIGADVLESQQKRLPFMHAWCEFALYDESTKKTEWIPVDVLKLRDSGSRTPSMTQPWLYFGTHPDLEQFAPLAFNWVPPTEDLVFNSGVAGLWAWNAKPQTPMATVEFRMSVGAAARRADDPKR